MEMQMDPKLKARSLLTAELPGPGVHKETFSPGVCLLRSASN